MVQSNCQGTMKLSENAMSIPTLSILIYATIGYVKQLQLSCY